ncbi:thiamine pyrophosphate-binding protein [Thomasclavelia sp.]|uniref:thiamine pyrophosphate-binding protein n=1 Tax=Thomasclavelia sp. TaxID=3025757 RepID=UPI0025DF85BE|nr:thiamine pyrophosphate-binding protein [Thomasclavelia sp.]
MNYTNNDNIEIITTLLKKHKIKDIIISPGGTNIPLIKSLQKDDFFTCYSIVDERSAIYFAIGVYLQTGNIVATVCTSAQATRNYIPGLTEAYYKHVPILAITMEKHPRFTYQEYMQAPDQTSLPNDSVKKSVELPYISDSNDVYHSIRCVNEAILELSREGMGPVQLCVPWLDFPLKSNNIKIRSINRFSKDDIKDLEIKDKSIMLVIGEHRPFNKEQTEIINRFCENYNVMVYVNHLSNFNNKYSINANLLLSTMKDEEFNNLKPDVFITIGGQTGDYPLFLTLSNNNIDIEHWRICEDGKIVDTYDKLTRIYQCSLEEFFSNVQDAECKEHSYYRKWELARKEKNININVPFSSLSIAQYLHNKIPKSSIIQFSILHSLRIWNLFELDSSIECYSNVGAFGIDGGMSTLIGQSIVTDKLSFIIIGDLAFYYDMNSLGIRDIKSNLRILLINNNGGVEFKLHGGNNKEINEYIAAGNHFNNAEGWANTCGFLYLSAHSMDEFIKYSEKFLSESDLPIILEVFVSDEDESEAYNRVLEFNKNLSVSEQVKKTVKNSVKTILGKKAVDKIRELKR